MLLHYLVKCLCSQLLCSRAAMQNSAIENSCCKIFIQWCWHNFVNWQRDIYSGYTENPRNHRLCATEATKKKDVTTKRLRTWSTFRQSLMTSVSESQVVEKTQVWYLSITESMLLRAAIVTWCCYNRNKRLLPPCVRSQASSSSFSRTVPGKHGAWGSQLSYR